MLTTLNTHKSFLNATTVFSPPSRALANYAKASDASANLEVDTVSLSEGAKAKPEQSSGLRKSAHIVALGLACLGALGSVGCASMASAAPSARTETVKVQSAQETGKTVGKEVSKLGQDLRREGKGVVDSLKGKNAQELGKTVGQESRKIGKEIGKEGQKIGKEAAKVGKEIGKEATKVGKEIGNFGKGFWKGLTGKGDKN